MVYIARDGSVVTSINLFAVSPKDRRPLVDLLVRATEEVVSRRPGYVSADSHESVDGKRVTDHARWQGREDFGAMFRNLEHVVRARGTGGICVPYEPRLCEVSYTHEVV